MWLSTPVVRLQLFVLIVSYGPVIAVAAVTATARSIDIFSFKWWLTLLCVQGVIVLSYAASSLPKWAKWDDGSRHDKLTIAQGVFVSVLAGNMAWSLSYYYAETHEALSWVITAMASYSGDAYLAKKMEQFLGSNTSKKEDP